MRRYKFNEHLSAWLYNALLQKHPEPMRQYYADQTVVSHASQSACFALASDAQAWASWCSAIQYSKQLSRGKLKKGSLLAIQIKLSPYIRLPVVLSITALEHDTSISWGVQTKHMTYLREFHFRTLPDQRTEITHKQWCEGYITPLSRLYANKIRSFNRVFCDDYLHYLTLLSEQNESEFA